MEDNRYEDNRRPVRRQGSAQAEGRRVRQETTARRPSRNGEPVRRTYYLCAVRSGNR